MGRLVDTADINNVLMHEKSNYGIFAVEIDRIISGIISKCPTIEQEPKTGKWIPVSEKLPNDGTCNLFTDGTQISIERYKMDALDHFFPSGRWFNLEDAVAWMPLPKPYKSQESEE